MSTDPNVIAANKLENLRRLQGDAAFLHRVLTDALLAAEKPGPTTPIGGNGTHDVTVTFAGIPDRATADRIAEAAQRAGRAAFDAAKKPAEDVIQVSNDGMSWMTLPRGTSTEYYKYVRSPPVPAEKPAEAAPVVVPLDPTDFALACLRNSGIDVTCGACMEVAFTEATTAMHTCTKPAPVAPVKFDTDGIAYLTETVWLVAEAFGAKRDCESCQAVVRKLDKRKLGYVCLHHGMRAEHAEVTPIPGDALVSREAAARAVEAHRPGWTAGVVEGVLIKDRDGPWGLPSDFAGVIRALPAATPAPVPSAAGETPALPWVVWRKSDGLVLAHVATSGDACRFAAAYPDDYAKISEVAPAAPAAPVVPVKFDERGNAHGDRWVAYRADQWSVEVTLALKPGEDAGTVVAKALVANGRGL